MQKRGLAAIIASVLMIMMVLLATIFLWYGVRPIVNSLDDGNSNATTGGTSATSCLTESVQAIGCITNTSENKLYVQVKRGSGGGSIDDLQLLFSLSDISYTISVTPPVGQFETKTYTITNSTLANATSVEAVVVLGNKACPLAGTPISCVPATAEQLILIETSACSDNQDNDDDGLTDWPTDPGCMNATDRDEVGFGNYERDDAYALNWLAISNPPENLFNTVQFIYFDPNPDVRKARYAVVASELEALEPGKRTIWVRSDAINDIFADNPLDDVNGLGSLIWWDNGIAELARLNDELLGNLSEQGVIVDNFYTDIETGFSIDHLCASRHGCPPELFESIENDPRFNSVDPLLGASIPSLIGFNDNLEQRIGYSSSQRFPWATVMNSRYNSYLNKAYFEPAKRHNSNVKVLNYETPYSGNFISCEHALPDPNGHGGFCIDTNLFPGRDHQYTRYLGNTISPVAYGGLLQITWPGRLAGVSVYPSNPFNSFRYAINADRQGTLSLGVPSAPWIGTYDWQGDFGDITMANTDYYKETILHVLMNNPSQIIYFNYPNSPRSNHELLSDLVTDFNQVAGFSERETMIDSLADFSVDYVISSMKSGGRIVHRFTPLVDGGLIRSPRDSLIRSDSTGMYFQTGEFTITFPQGALWNSSVSAGGFWIVQPANAPEPIITRVHTAPIVSTSDADIIHIIGTPNFACNGLTCTLRGVATNVQNDPTFMIDGWQIKSATRSGAAIADPGSPATQVTFPGAGTYVLTLTAHDSRTVRSDDLKFTISN